MQKMFDPKKFNTQEYVRQIIEAVQSDKDSIVEILLEEYGAKVYTQARRDAADDVVAMFGTR